MIIKYRPAAINDIEQTADYIENQLKNPSAAKKLKTILVTTIALLKDNPEMGMKLSDKYDVESDYRFIIINKQIVFYEIHFQYIEIVRVLDGRTDFLTHLF